MKKSFGIICCMLLLTVIASVCAGCNEPAKPEIVIDLYKPQSSECYEKGSGGINLSFNEGEVPTQPLKLRITIGDGESFDFTPALESSHMRLTDENISFIHTDSYFPQDIGTHMLAFTFNDPSLRQGINPLYDMRVLCVTVTVVAAFEPIGLGRFLKEIYIRDAVPEFRGEPKFKEEYFIQFTAPVRGEYIFETRGEVAAAVGMYSENKDFDGQENFKRILGEGESLLLKSIPLHPAEGRLSGWFTLRAILLSPELDIDQPNRRTFYADDVQYFRIRLEEPMVKRLHLPEGWSATLMPIGPVDELNRERELASDISILFGRGEERYIRVENISGQDMTEEISLLDPVEIVLLEQYKGKMNVYSFTPEFTGGYFIDINPEAGRQICDDNFFWLQPEQFSRIYRLERDRVYYVQAEGYTGEGFSIAVKPHAEFISFGQQSVTLAGATLFRLSAHNMDGIVSVECSQTIEFSLLDSSLTLVEDRYVDGKSSLTYYLAIYGGAGDAEVTISFAVSAAVGVFPSCGFVYVRYDIEMPDYYVVTGVDAYSWHYSPLFYEWTILRNGECYLSSGTGYLKFYGTPGDSYSVSLSQTVIVHEVGENYYGNRRMMQVTVTESGWYYVYATALSSPRETLHCDIIDEDGGTYVPKFDTWTDNRTFFFEPGVYLFRMHYDASQLGLYFLLRPTSAPDS